MELFTKYIGENGWYLGCLMGISELIPSGKHTKNHERSQFSMSKSTN